MSGPIPILLVADLQKDPCYFRLFHDKWRKQFGDVFTIYVGEYLVYTMQSRRKI